MSALQAVNIQTQSQYDEVIAVLKYRGFKALQLKETFKSGFIKRYITIEDRYMQLSADSKLLADKGYQVVSFEDFIGEQIHE